MALTDSRSNNVAIDKTESYRPVSEDYFKPEDAIDGFKYLGLGLTAISASFIPQLPKEARIASRVGGIAGVLCGAGRILGGVRNEINGRRTRNENTSTISESMITNRNTKKIEMNKVRLSEVDLGYDLRQRVGHTPTEVEEMPSWDELNTDKIDKRDLLATGVVIGVPLATAYLSLKGKGLVKGLSRVALAGEVAIFGALYKSTF